MIIARGTRCYCGTQREWVKVGAYLGADAYECVGEETGLTYHTSNLVSDPSEVRLRVNEKVHRRRK